MNLALAIEANRFFINKAGNIMQNQFNPGKGWDGKKTKQPTITYNGKTQTVQAWSVELQICAHTLSWKMRQVNKGLMTFDHAMANKQQRYQIEIDRKRERRQAIAAEKRKHPKKPTKKQLAGKKDAAIQQFLYGAMG